MTSKGNAGARWTAQITDFGLSKQLHSYSDSYVSLPAAAANAANAAAPATKSSDSYAFC
jgi:hypothetical protein